MMQIPFIETERLILRGIEPRDLEASIAFMMSERAEFIGRKKTRTDAWRSIAGLIGHWTLHGFGPWAVADKQDDRILGVVGPWYPDGWPEPEMSWTLYAEAEGRGFAYEAAHAALDHAFGPLGWKTAVSYIDPENTRSSNLAERLGAKLDLTAKHPDFDGDPCLVYRHPAPGGMA